MSWFGFGTKKKKKNPEEEYKVKLDQLEKLGHSDRAKNLQHLKLYAGDVNKVIQDYMLQKPSSSSSQSPQKDEKPKSTPPKVVKKEEPKPTPKQPEIKPNPPKSKQPKPIKKEDDKLKQSAQPTVTESKPIKPEEAKQQTEAKKPQIPKATMPKPILKTDDTKTSDTVTSKTIKLQNNLTNLISSDLRQLLINIGEPMIAEIVLSNSIDGQCIYDYDSTNALLKKFNLSFGDKASYQSMVQQIENCYQKSGVVDIHNRESIKLSEEAKPQTEVDEKKDDSKEKEYYILKQNVSNLIASDVMTLTMPYNVELAQRLFAFSITGSDLCKFDYDGVVFATGIDRKKLSKECWNRMVSELKLPQSEPFDAAKWKKLQKSQEDVIAKATKLSKQIENVQKNKNKPKKQKKVNKRPQKINKQNAGKKQKQVQKGKNVKGGKSEKERLSKIVQIEKETDKFLPKMLLKVKERQMNTLTTLHDMAAIVDLNPEIIAKIEQSARRQSEKQLADYLTSSGNVRAAPKSKDVSVSAKDVEQRQLKLLSTIYSTRSELEKLAKSKGVSLSVITGKMKVNESEINLDVLSKGFDELFQNLADMALTVQQTAKQYGIKLDKKECQEVDKHVVPMYGDLEKKQNALIAKCNYLNARVKMML